MEGEENDSITIEIVQRKIGRNLILFQELEHSLKMMVAMASISGYATDLKKIKSAEKIG